MLTTIKKTKKHEGLQPVIKFSNASTLLNNNVKYAFILILFV